MALLLIAIGITILRAEGAKESFSIYYRHMSHYLQVNRGVFRVINVQIPFLTYNVSLQ